MKELQPNMASHLFSEFQDIPNFEHFLDVYFWTADYDNYYSS